MDGFANPLGAVEPGANHTSGNATPNVIFVLADDLGWSDLGCYGQKEIHTPNIDRLAAEGLRFSQAYAGSSVCAPSRCALMTGQHTGHTPIRGNSFTKPEGQQPLAEGVETLGHLMRRAGYATGVFGKWGLGGPGSSGEPARQGFDEFLGYLCQGLAHNYYPTMLRRSAEAVSLDGKTWSHDRIEAEAMDFIRRHRDRPFFLYAAFTLPHGELQVPDIGSYADRPWPDELKIFAAMVTRLDASVQHIVMLLRDLGIEENTLLLIASDNGAEPFYFHKAGKFPLAVQWEKTFHSHGPLRGYKRDLFEGGIRVPLIARWPGHIRPGVSAHVCAFWDVLPTMAELTGQPAPKGSDGVSFLPTLLGEPTRQQTHDHLYWEFHEGGFSQTVRFGDWKAVRLGPSQPVQLYDLGRDVAESRDVALQHPDVVEKAADLLRPARSDAAEWPVKDTGKPVGGSSRFFQPEPDNRR
jgi:arylsulfatase A-like enzyme